MEVQKFIDVAPCGNPDCGGCYEVAPKIFLHPPRVVGVAVRTERQRMKAEDIAAEQLFTKGICQHCSGAGRAGVRG